MSYRKKFFSIFVFVLLISFAVYLSFEAIEMALSKQIANIDNGFVNIVDYDFNNSLIKLKGDFTTNQKYDENNNSYITYKATIKKPTYVSSLGIKVPTVIGYYEFFVDGIELDPINHFYSYDSKFFNISKYYFFENTHDDFDIELKFYVHNSSKPYIADDIIIASNANMYIYNQISTTILVLGCTILLVFSILLFFIYLTTIKTEKLIFLSVFSILVFIKILLLYTSFTKYPSLNLDEIYSFKLILSTTLLAVFYLYLYFVNIYNRTYKVIHCSIIICVVVCILYTVTSYNQNTTLIMTNIISYILYLLILVFSILNLFKHKKDGVLNFIFAVFLLTFMIISAKKHGLLLHIDYPATVFIIVLIIKFTIKQIIYHKKNLLIKYNLQKEVKLRTVDLIQKNLDFDKEKTARLTAEENLKNISNYNIQTGLFNYTYAITYIGDLINIFQRYNHIFSVIIIEVNNLNFIYETFGLELKTEILDEIIRIIRLVVRRTDLLTSWHDDKFMIIIPNGTKKSSVNVVNKLLQLIENNLINGYGNVTINYGIATIEPNDRTESIINRVECELKNNFNKNTIK